MDNTRVLQRPVHSNAGDSFFSSIHKPTANQGKETLQIAQKQTIPLKRTSRQLSFECLTLRFHPQTQKLEPPCTA